MSATIVLVRHGHHEETGIRLSGRSQIALSPEGRAEAARIAGRLAGTPVCAITSSPRRRCLETAAIIALGHNLRVAPEDALDEIDFGDWTGRSFDELAPDPLWKAWNDDRATAKPPCGETMQAAAKRIVDHVETYRHRNGTFISVTHGDLIRAVVCFYGGRSLNDILTFEIGTGTATTLRLGESGTTSVQAGEPIA